MSNPTLYEFTNPEGVCGIYPIATLKVFDVSMVAFQLGLGRRTVRRYITQWVRRGLCRMIVGGHE